MHPCRKDTLYRRDGFVAWAADVPDSLDKYVALFNTHDAAETESVKVIFETLGLQGHCAVRDLWGRKDLGEFSSEFVAPIPSHGAGLYQISPE
jgi:alpha-galactosidase